MFIPTSFLYNISWLNIENTDADLKHEIRSKLEIFQFFVELYFVFSAN